MSGFVDTFSISEQMDLAGEQRDRAKQSELWSASSPRHAAPCSASL
jgi:hypothetical protein